MALQQLDKVITDSILGTAAISTPIWVEHVTTYGGLVMLIGGLVLLGFRIALSWKEWKKPNG